MFMVIKEDIQNLIFKCEKMIEANNIKEKRLKKERKNLERALKEFEINEENEVVFTEVTNRLDGITLELITLKSDKKYLSKVITKNKPLLCLLELNEFENEVKDSEIELLEMIKVE